MNGAFVFLTTRKPHLLRNTWLTGEEQARSVRLEDIVRRWPCLSCNGHQDWFQDSSVSHVVHGDANEHRVTERNTGDVFS